jgi:hypothetical protein
VAEALAGDHGKPDVSALGPVFRAFLDNCDTRDRYISTIRRSIYLPRGGRLDAPNWLKATGIDLSLRLGPAPTALGYLVSASGFPNCLLGGSGPYLPPAPRLRRDLLMNADVPAEDRAALITLFAFYRFNNDRFVAERRADVAYLNRSDADAELIRRTAVWGVAHDGEPDDLGNVAQVRLAESNAPADQELLARLFLQRPIACSLDAMRHSIDAGHEKFIQLLLDHLRTASGPSFDWVGRLLAQEHEATAVPILVARLKDADATVRHQAAFNLCWIPSPDAVPGLLAALHEETDDGARDNIVMAICQTGDARGLDALITAAKSAKKQAVLIQLCRGFSRIGDAKALPAVGNIALHASQVQVRNESVQTFGRLSGLYKGDSPNRFWSSGGIETDKIRTAMPIIQKWMNDHPADAK